jgi:hypothetical protein
MPPAPDLQALVEQSGGYHRISREAWAKHYNQMITVWVWLAMRHFPRKTKLPVKRIIVGPADGADERSRALSRRLQ